MKEVLEKIHTFCLYMRIGILCLGALFLVFWFYRFFNLPFAHTLAIFFDLPLKIFPLPLETLETYEGHEVQNGYFIDAIVCAVFAFIFYLCEIVVLEVQRRYNMHDVKTRQALQEQMNKELEREYLNGIYRYDYYSFYIKYRIDYLSEVLAHKNPYKPEEVTKEAYKLTALYIKKAMPQLDVKYGVGFVFVVGKNFNNYEEIITKITTVIKTIKKQNEKKYLRTEFMIVSDVQTNIEDSYSSAGKLKKMTRLEYYNKAIVTLTLKTRFDLCNSSKYTVDILGVAAPGRDISKESTDIYVFKTKEESF